MDASFNSVDVATEIRSGSDVVADGQYVRLADPDGVQVINAAGNTSLNIEHTGQVSAPQGTLTLDDTVDVTDQLTADSLITDNDASINGDFYVALNSFLFGDIDIQGNLLNAGTGWFGGNLTTNLRLTAGNILAGNTVSDLNAGNELALSDTSPQIEFNDTDHSDYWIHVNGDRFYILPDNGAGTGWGSLRPFTIYNGTVGIGDTGPDATLDVEGSLNAHSIFGENSSDLIITSNSGYYVDIRPNDPTYGLILRQNGDTGDYGNIEVGETYLGLGKNTSGAHLAIEDGGNVGINTTNPTSRLDVNGHLRANSIGSFYWRTSPSHNLKNSGDSCYSAGNPNARTCVISTPNCNSGDLPIAWSSYTVSTWGSDPYTSVFYVWNGGVSGNVAVAFGVSSYSSAPTNYALRALCWNTDG